MEEITLILFIAAITVIVILLIREIATWYWKINTIVYELREQNDALSDILKELKDKKNKDA